VSNRHDLDGRSIGKVSTPTLLWQFLPDWNKGYLGRVSKAAPGLRLRIAHAFPGATQEQQLDGGRVLPGFKLPSSPLYEEDTRAALSRH
jgi:hypothetical protein